jgi:uncharacterized protein YuzE
MKITYDNSIDAAYVRINNGAIAYTQKISDQILIDKDTHGKVLGIEILGNGQIIVENIVNQVKNARA